MSICASVCWKSLFVCGITRSPVDSETGAGESEGKGDTEDQPEQQENEDTAVESVREKCTQKRSPVLTATCSIKLDFKAVNIVCVCVCVCVCACVRA